MEKPLSRATFLVKIRSGEKCIYVRGARAIITSKCLFAWDVQLPMGTSVVVQLCDRQHDVTLSGTVSASDADLGVGIDFKETTESLSQRLAALLDDQRA